MGIESGVYIGDLVSTNPTGTDPKSQGDDHLRLIKSVLQNTFAGVPGLAITAGEETQGASVNDYVIDVSPQPTDYTAFFFVSFVATHENTDSVTVQINGLDQKPLVDVTGNQLHAATIKINETVVAWYDGNQFHLISGNDKASRIGDKYSGTHDFTGATVQVPTMLPSDNSSNAASTEYVDSSAALKADLDSPNFTGIPTAPTAATGTATDQLATCAFVVATAFNAALPGQTGNAGKFITTDGTNAYWAPHVPPQIIRNVRTSGQILTNDDSQKLIVIVGPNTFTQTFAAAATLGSGWFCYYQNIGTGDITITPSAGEYIDALTGFVMYPGEVRLIQCDGFGLSSIVLNSFFKTFTSSGTFIKPPGYNQFSGLLWGGGASGGKGSANAAATEFAGCGGGGGGCAPFTIHSSFLGSTVEFIIGSGGAASTRVNKGGGYSIFNRTGVGSGTIMAYGGTGNTQQNTASDYAPTQGGWALHKENPAQFLAPTVSLYLSGEYGGGYPSRAPDSSGLWTTTTYGGAAGTSPSFVNSARQGMNTVFGGAGGGSVGGTIPSPTLHYYGKTIFGGAGGAASINSPGVDGSPPGGGGGGTYTGETSGAGARGELRIWGVI